MGSFAGYSVSFCISDGDRNFSLNYSTSFRFFRSGHFFARSSTSTSIFFGNTSSSSSSLSVSRLVARNLIDLSRFT